MSVAPVENYLRRIESNKKAFKSGYAYYNVYIILIDKIDNFGINLSI